MSNETKKQGFSQNFYVANVLEIFERLAWYGFFNVAAIYMTGSVASGGLGFSEAQRGVLLGLIPFFVYLLPVFTGAIADKVGYKKMFIVAFIILMPSYYLLGQVSGFWPFFGWFFLVALGAAIFKPLVVGTVSRSANDDNRGLAFGIFYMMVNIGGAVGPILSGALRNQSWDYVFIFPAIAMAVNLVIVLLFFKEDDFEKQNAGGISQAFKDVQEVLGNGRFALLVGPIVFALMLAGGDWINFTQFFIFVGAWCAIHFIWDLQAKSDAQNWFAQKVAIGNGPFLVYLLILTIFWTGYVQIFNSYSIYIRDFVDTADLVQFANAISPALGNFLASANVDNLAAALPDIASNFLAADGANAARSAQLEIVDFQVRPSETEITQALQAIANNQISANEVAARWAAENRQVNPEFIISGGFITIVLFQIMISHWAEGKAPFAILIFGTLLIAASYVVGGMAYTMGFAGLCVLGVMVSFSFGEMLASPKSQEYVASFAPKEKAAMFMGYYFVSMALGFLFGGLVSGWAYQKLAIDANQPFMMWVLYAGISVLAALALFVFNKTLASKMKA